MSHTPPVGIVTGAASGIGRAIAHKLLSEGWNLIVCDISPAIEEEYSHEISAGRAQARVIDVTNTAAPELIVRAALDTYGKLDALINNAGTGGPNQTVVDIDLSELRKTLEVNVVSVVALTQCALPALIDSRGVIVNIGSLFADEPVVEGASYCMSKAAIHTLTQTLTLEYGPRGVRSNTISPGYILTPMHKAEVSAQAQAQGITQEERLDQLREEVPLRRHGVPEDIATAVVWLLSPDSSYVCGQNIAVNGGVSFT